MKLSEALSVLIFSIAYFVAISDAFEFDVGGKEGWVKRPKEEYKHWAQRLRFQINDTLVFRYKKGNDSVLLVNKDDYNNCSTKHPIKTMTSGVSVFKFPDSGTYYFISGNHENCRAGQRLDVVVLTPANKTTPSGPSLAPHHSAVPPSSQQPPAKSPLPVIAMPPHSPSVAPYAPSPQAPPPHSSAAPPKSPSPAMAPNFPSPAPAPTTPGSGPPTSHSPSQAPVTAPSNSPSTSPSPSATATPPTPSGNPPAPSTASPPSPGSASQPPPGSPAPSQQQTPSSANAPQSANQTSPPPAGSSASITDSSVFMLAASVLFCWLLLAVFQ